MVRGGGNCERKKLPAIVGPRYCAFHRPPQTLYLLPFALFPSPSALYLFLKQFPQGYSIIHQWFCPNTHTKQIAKGYKVDAHGGF